MTEPHIDLPDWCQPFFAPARYKVAHGGRGCIHPDSLIDTPNGAIRIADFKGGEVFAFDGASVVVAYAGRPAFYPAAQLYRVVFDDGAEIKTTAKHRFLTARGWVACSSLLYGDLIAAPRAESPDAQPLKYCGASLSELTSSVRHCLQTLAGFQWHCFEDCHQGDAQLLRGAKTVLDVARRLSDVPPHSFRSVRHEDAPVSWHTHNLSRLSCHLASLGGLLAEVARNFAALGIDSADTVSGLFLASSQALRLSHEKSSLERQAQQLARLLLGLDSLMCRDETLQRVFGILRLEVDDSSYSSQVSCNPSRIITKKVVLVEPCEWSVYCDIFVPFFNNYISAGVVHHNSGKSWAFARMILIMSLHKRIRILCARELQNSIQESVHQLLVDQIHALGLTGAFQIFESKIISATGSDFLFKGLRGMKNNAQSIKSLEGVDICWIEEGQTISAASFQTLAPTIRKPGAEIWVTLNPDSDADAVYQLVKNPPDGSIVRKVNWEDNPWFAQTSLPAEREWMLATDPDAYAHVWGGECRKNSAAQVLRGKYSVRSFDVAHDWDGPYQGADWGFSTDPSAFVRCWIGGRTLYIEAEAYAVGVEIDALPALFDGASPQARKTTTRADNSRPETISYMQRHGYSRLIAADKWPGSVEDGVAFLRSFEEIVIHPSCKHTAEEARLYSYKTDRHTGDVLTALADKHNHAMDALRYALAPLIRKRTAGISTMNVKGL